MYPATTKKSGAGAGVGLWTSRILDPRIIGDEHYDVAQTVKGVLQRYKDLQDIIAILGVDELSEEDKELIAQIKGKEI